MSEDCTVNCGPSCEWIFSRLRIMPLVAGGTIVEWSMHPQFADPAPYLFQLQISPTGNPDADDWEDVGDEVEDEYSVTDTEQREFGQIKRWHYRLTLATANGVYISKPQFTLGNLSNRDWQMMRGIIRSESVQLKSKIGGGQEGYLLKRRLYGTACSCTDEITGECRNAQCDLCYGTGFVGGYYDPYPCFYVKQSTWRFRSVHDQMSANNENVVMSGRMINVPEIFSYDIWVDKDTDQRWQIHSINIASHWKGVPIVLDPVEMRLLPFSHPSYLLNISGQQS